ncbi:MAG TPA: fused MFS/spermidine synthase [Bryobacteraceae bacterium]|nr:fused MFS/spermidine synthase [Bryobacteraceae bacterium]
MLLYACTILLSAFLLFEVQPLIGKIILPWFGGGASVWSTCLLFFQTSLLAGYLYAHFSTRFLRPKGQAMLHCGLMAASLALLPIYPSAYWKPTQAGDPSVRILLLLAATIGLPYVLLSTTSPLLQAWFVARRPGVVPYRLFALSNFGSLVALFTFPVLVEPLLTSHVQAYRWSAIYALFVVICSVVAWQTLGSGSEQRADLPRVTAPAGGPAPGWRLHVLWAALAACASALLLAVTNHLSQNVAPIPFLWVVPLGLYLLSFIICFERDRWYRRAVFLPALAVTLGVGAWGLYYSQGNLVIRWALPAFAGLLFACCMVCHGELARLKPDPRHLTSFYLMVSLGGALGGLFVAIGAPHLFHSYVELPLLMVATPILAAMVLWIAPGEWPDRRKLVTTRILLLVLAVALGGYMGYKKREDEGRYTLALRNFYGVLRVQDAPDTDTQTGVRRLVHGTISHGQQITDPARHRTPTSYYGPKSGVGRAFQYLQQRPAVRAGLIGLGAGVTAAYCRPGDFFRFYEINPFDLALATTVFTFLRDCPADHQVLLGDARLTMEQQPSEQFDVLAVDAFSSDAIPIHLLTREAFAVYYRQLKPGGILAVHVSNRYLDLIPVVAQNARDTGKAAIDVDDDADEYDDYLSSSDWVLVTADPVVFSQPAFQASGIKPVKPRPRFRPWTDDYSNLFQILR